MPLSLNQKQQGSRKTRESDQKTVSRPEFFVLGNACAIQTVSIWSLFHKVFSVAIIATLPYSIAVSRLRRPFLSDRYFFIAARLLRRREKFTEPDFALLARAFNRARALHPFHLTEKTRTTKAVVRATRLNSFLEWGSSRQKPKPGSLGRWTCAHLLHLVESI